MIGNTEDDNNGEPSEVDKHDSVIGHNLEDENCVKFQKIKKILNTKKGKLKFILNQQRREELKRKFLNSFKKKNGLKRVHISYLTKIS